MPDLEDDRSPVVIPFVLERLAEHKKYHDGPFFIGLNGLQGVGKTTLVTALETTLQSSPHNIPTLTLSIDDLYLPRAAQQQLAEAHPDNPLIQHRGQPATHDVELGLSIFNALRDSQNDLYIPTYDKSAFSGKGDRAPKETWRVVNQSGDITTNGAKNPSNRPVEAVIFEGWCVGFRPLKDEEIQQIWELKVKEEDEKQGGSGGRLGLQKLEDAMFVNDKLRAYDELTDFFDAFIHIDAEDTKYVYPWRLESEAGLRKARGTGMTDKEVIDFVNGYYPSYELFTPTLREGIFPGQPGKQLRLVVDRQRRLVRHEVI